MSLVTWLLFLAVGRLVTWLLQVNGLTKPVWEAKPVLTELRDCDLCLGFWVYLALALTYTRQIFGLWPRPIEAGILAAITAFLGHLLRIGYQDKFGTIYIE